MLIVVDGHWIVVVLMLGYDVWIEYLIAQVRDNHIGTRHRHEAIGEFALFDDKVTIILPSAPVLVLTPAIEGVTRRLPYQGIRHYLNGEEDVSYAARFIFGAKPKSSTFLLESNAHGVFLSYFKGGRLIYHLTLIQIEEGDIVR